MSLTIRRRRNKIQAVKCGHDWIYNKEGIEYYFIKNFTKLYQSVHSELSNEVGEHGEKVISDIDNALIVDIPPVEEVKNCVNKLHPLKSQGPDGFFGSFFRNYWNTVGEKGGEICSKMF